MNAIELIAALKGADEETAMELVERLQCGEIDCSVLPTGKDNAVQQAQIWAQEARTQKGIVEEIGKLVGCANDWEMVDAIKAALSANGGEAVPVAWAVFADSGNIRIWGQEKPEAFPEAVPLYLSQTVKESLTAHLEPIGYADPDTLTDYRAGERLHIPVYRPDASAEWQSGIPVYLHPAPPSVAVPDEILTGIRDALRMLDEECGDTDPLCEPEDMRESYPLIWCHQKLFAILSLLTAAPSPNHSGDANEVCAAPASFGSAGELADWLDSFYETLDDGSFTGSKWGVAQTAVKAVRGHDHIADAGKVVPENELKARVVSGARDMLRESGKQFRAIGDIGHAAMCENHADELDRLRTTDDKAEGV
jgi:hypothetical protein